MNPPGAGSSGSDQGSSGIASATFGLGVLSSAISGYGKMKEGKQQQAGYEYKAQVDVLNAAEQVGATEQKFSERVGQQASSYAAAGVDIASGSPLLIMAATAARGAREAEQIKQAGDEQATLDRYYGKMAAFNGKLSGIGSFLSGVSSAATSYGKFLDNPTPTPAGG